MIIIGLAVISQEQFQMDLVQKLDSYRTGFCFIFIIKISCNQLTCANKFKTGSALLQVKFWIPLIRT